MRSRPSLPRVARTASASASASRDAFEVERARESVKVSRASSSRGTGTALAGCEYEVIRVRAREGGERGTKTRVFVVPGNPGVPAFYETFALALGEATAAARVDGVGRNIARRRNDRRRRR